MKVGLQRIVEKDDLNIKKPAVLSTAGFFAMGFISLFRQCFIDNTGYQAIHEMADQAHHACGRKLEGHVAHSHHHRHENERKQEPKDHAKDESGYDAVPFDYTCKNGEYHPKNQTDHHMNDKSYDCRFAAHHTGDRLEHAHHCHHTPEYQSSEQASGNTGFPIQSFAADNFRLRHHHFLLVWLNHNAYIVTVYGFKLL